MGIWLPREAARVSSDGRTHGVGTRGKELYTHFLMRTTGNARGLCSGQASAWA